MCFTKKNALSRPGALEKTEVFLPMAWMCFGVPDAAWVTSHLLPAMPNPRRCCGPRAAGSPGGQRCHGVFGVTPKPSSMREHRRWQARTVQCRRTAGNWGATGPAPFAKAPAPAPPGQRRAGSAERRPSPLFRLLPFPSVLPLVFHRKDSAGFSLPRGGPTLAWPPASRPAAARCRKEVIFTRFPPRLRL